MSKIIVFDLDGTLADISHRRPLVTTKPKNWTAFNAKMEDDLPAQDIIWMNHNLFNIGCTIIICSGRSEDHKNITVDWLFRHGVIFDDIFMRKAGDFRADCIIKLDLLDQIRKNWGEPYLWFDDRDQVVQAIRSEGVRVLQVAKGDF